MFQLLKKRQNVYAILLFLVVFTMSIGYKLNSLSIILLTIFYFLDINIKAKIKLAKPIVFYLFTGYFLLHFIGYLMSQNKLVALHEVEVKLGFIVLPLIIFTEPINKERIYNVLIVLKYWFIVLAFFLIHYELLVLGKTIFTIPAYSLKELTNIHHTYFSLLYSFFMFFTMHQIKTKKIEDIFGYLQLLFFLFFIAILGARITVGFVSILVFIFLIQQSVKKSGLKQLFMIVLLLFASVSIVLKTKFIEKVNRLKTTEWNIERNIKNHEQLDEPNNKTTPNTIELKLLQWHCAFNILKENPITGVGSGDYKKELYDEYKNINFKMGILNKYNTHNQYLEEFLKFGVIWGVCFMCFIVFILFRAFRENNQLLFLTTFLITCFLCIESVFTRQHGVLFFTYFIPLLYMYHTKSITDS